MNKILIVFLCFILISISLFGQSEDIEFDHYTSIDGLSNDYINTVFRDSRGFVWMGTANGLNRFDGFNFKAYYSDNKDSSSIPGGRVNSLVEDSLGNLWVGTGNGLCVYDRKKDNFLRKKLKVNEYIYSDIDITCSFIDREGFMWMSAYTGIFRLKLINNPQIINRIIDAEVFLLDEIDVADGFKYYIPSFTMDDRGIIWLTSYSNQMFYFDKKQNKFLSQPIMHPESNKFKNKAKYIIKDRDGDFFISIAGTGLLMWERKENDFTLFKPDGSNRTPKGNILFALAEDKNGMIWIGDRYSEGINIFDKKTGEFTFCQKDDSNPYTLLTNQINSIYQDNTGTMWIGTIAGINKYSPGKAKFKRYFSSPNRIGKLSYNNILCFEESKNDNLWIGTDGGGLNKLNRKTGKFIHYIHDPFTQGSLSSNAIISICEDHEETLWMGTYDGGLARMKDNKFQAFLPDPENPYSISNRHIWYVYEDSKKNLWVATLNSGLDLFDRKTNRFYNYKKKDNDSSSICNNANHGLYEDSKQHLYITTYIGVSIIDLNKCDFSKSPPVIHFKNLYHDETKNSISNNNVYCVKEDNEGNIWFGTIGSGIDMLDRVTGKFTNYSMKDGLPGNAITSILVDKDNNLWLATDNGLAKFNPQTKEVVVFDRKDGLQNKILKSWAIKTKDGEMFFGGPDGFNSFYPEQLKFKENHNQPPVVLTGLKIFNNPVKIDEFINNRVVLNNNLSETRELVLTHKENFFTIEFIALDYTAPEKNLYAYMMEGFDFGWVYCGNKREANYTNLDAGKYTFRVKASNNDGVWNNTGASLQIVILPPWWETWWFMSIVLFVIISVVTSIFFSRIRYFKNQKILLEKLVEKKTSELQQMNTLLVNQTEDLKKTNALLEVRQEEIEAQSEELMVQKESLEIMNHELNDLNATKDKFFSIIAHDIKSPFNAILGFLELFKENFNKWTDEKKLNTINLILNSSRSLFELLENLLQWSRSQRGIIEYNPEIIELKKTLSNIINLMKANALSKNIKLDFTLSEDGLALFADKQMLDTILRNLISNALKFTNTGGNVQIRATKNNEFVKIEVSDDGVGIPGEILDKLFSIENNHTTPGTHNEKGTGLGLILAKDFVTKNGGIIGINSTVGKGSTFYFTLPLAK